MSNCYLCIHGHFYQPPRMDPFTGQIPREPDAAPYANWNERITAECYAPNAEGRPQRSVSNFRRISFNLGGTLARWLDEHAHTTYERIVAAERDYWQTHAVGNGLAQPVHHTILHWLVAATGSARSAGVSPVSSAALATGRKGCGSRRWRWTMKR